MHRAQGLVHALLERVVPVVLAAVATLPLCRAVGIDPPPPSPRPPGKVDRKGTAPEPDLPLLGTLVDTHSPLRLIIDDASPAPTRFEAMLRDPVRGDTHAIDPALLDLVRRLARAHPLARVEVVSGFRSPKLNEALRKKGHHVATHSQHTLGHALDLRIVPDGRGEPLDPRAVKEELRRSGWRGGVGVYLKPEDRFVHADVGPMRTWNGM
jgi:uncharacterized protein YcbK (DUF882 family)